MSVTAARSDVAAARRRRRWAGAALLGAALLLYVLTLDNGFQPYELRGGDLITHQYAQVQARPSNAPGYPLYTMGGWLWFHTLRPLIAAIHPVAPNPMPILSSYSTLWALAAVALLYAIVCRVTVRPRHPAGNWPVACLIAAFYAVTYFFWYYATTTEQYSSAIAQTLAIIYVYLLWRDAECGVTSYELRVTSEEFRVERDALSPFPGALTGELVVQSDPPLAPRPSRLVTRHSSFVTRHSSLLLFLLAFLCGLSLAHMLTIAFIVPPLVIVVLWQAPYLVRSPRAIVGSVLAAALPLLSYGYVYARGAAHPEWRGRGDWETTGEWFWSFVSTAQGREELSWGLAPDAAVFGNGFPELMWQELSIPLFVLGIGGILLLDRKLSVLLYGVSALTLFFSWAYRFGNWYQVILPVYPLLLIGTAACFDWLDNMIAKRTAAYGPATRRVLTAAPLALLAIAVVWRADASLPAADSRNRPNDTALDRAAVLLDQPLPDAVGLFAAVDDALALQYLTEIWGLGAGARMLSSREAGSRLDAGQPILSTWEAAATLAQELPVDLSVQRQPYSPDWIAFAPQGSPNLTPPAQADTRPAPDGTPLAHYTASAAPDGEPINSAPPGIDITLFWRLDSEPWPPDLRISVRPTVNGALMPDPAAPDAALQQDRAAPANGLHSAAQDGVLLVDPYRFPGADEADGVWVILYRTVDGGFENVAELRLPLSPQAQR